MIGSFKGDQTQVTSIEFWLYSWINWTMFKSQRKMVYFSVDELLINCLICSKIYQSNEKNEKKKKKEKKKICLEN